MGIRLLEVTVSSAERGRQVRRSSIHALDEECREAEGSQSCILPAKSMMETDRMNRILILFAHPALEKSRVNRQLAAAVRELPGVTFHDLYEAYPEFDIDVRREQDLMV